MNNYYSKHRHFIFLWIILMIIVGVSGYFTYFRKTVIQTNQNTQNDTKNPPEINEEKLITDTKKVTSIQEKNILVKKIADSPIKVDDPNIEPTITTPKIAETENNQPPTITTTNTIPFTLAINGKTTQTRTEPGATVYKAMQNLMAENKFTFHANEYPGIGYFVDEINGLKNDPKNGIYWIYYINGLSAKVGISLYSLKPNDIITWKYEKSKF